MINPLIPPKKNHCSLTVAHKIEHTKIISFYAGQKEDGKEFPVLYKKYSPMLQRYLVALGSNDRCINEDFIQDIFLKLWERKSKLHLIESFDNYLFRMARNHLANEKIKETVKQKYLRYLEDTIVGYANTTASALFYKDASRIYCESVKQLPQRAATAYCLKENHGFKAGTIAEIMDISESTAKQHLQKALKKIRIFVSDQYTS